MAFIGKIWRHDRSRHIQRQSYRDKARCCVETAQGLSDPAERVVMLGIARDYISLADHVERRHDRNTGHSHERAKP